MLVTHVVNMAIAYLLIMDIPVIVLLVTRGINSATVFFIFLFFLLFYFILFYFIFIILGVV